MIFFIQMTLASLRSCPTTRSRSFSEEAIHIRKQFTLSDVSLQQVILGMQNEADSGLKRSSGKRLRNGQVKESGLPMLRSFIENVPNGDESGVAISIDMGGTNIRSSIVSLDSNKGSKILATVKEEITEKMKSWSIDLLFKHITKMVKNLLDTVYPQQVVYINAGFTFSFPVNQYASNIASLKHWTKGFKISGTEFTDLVKKFNNQLRLLEQYEQFVSCTVILNDSVATLLASQYVNKLSKIGLILGTGTNAAYFDGRIKQFINVEWGNFNREYFESIQTSYDIFASQLFFEDQPFEMLISGKYLGIIVQQILKEWTHKYFDIANAELQLDTEDVSRIINNPKHANVVLARLAKDVSFCDEELEIIAEICDLVGKRSATLVAVSVIGLIRSKGFETNPSETVVIGVDGSLYEHFPNYKNYMMKTFKDLRYDNIELFQVKDGSSIGAAIAALQNE
eukprot:NODE_66_length_25735_cov_0.318497.p6 type:complete len:454 gc:universal NODE_66_length_25735_cov_0.318497:5021-3660(-)